MAVEWSRIGSIGSSAKIFAMSFRKAEIVLPLSSRLPWRVRAAAEGEKAGGEKQEYVIRPIERDRRIFYLNRL
jgi:hypothetical protein